MRFFGSCVISPPVALNYVATYIKKNLPKHEVEVYNGDFTAEGVPTLSNSIFTSNHQEYVRRLTDANDPVWVEIGEVISGFKPEVVGVSSMTASFVSALNVCQIAKKINPAIVTVMGGKHPTALPDLTLKNKAVDFVVFGEGEETFRELLENLEKPDEILSASVISIASIKGLAHKDSNGDIRINPPRPYLKNIDALPFPIFESKLQKYNFENTTNPEAYTWIILSARGCPFQCLYCASDRSVRFRSPENVAEEIRLVKEKYGITRFCFEDDSFSLNKDRLLKLCSMLQAEKVKWICNTRVDLLDEPIVKSMKESGCLNVAIGIESGSEKTLGAIKKKITIEKVHDAVKLLRKNKILVTGYFMIGFPWETKREMRETVVLMDKMSLDLSCLSIVTPLPGTQLFQSLVDAGKIVPATLDWKRFHQGSPFMNFSDYKDADWEKTILALVKRAFRSYRKKYFFATIRKLFQEPFSVLTKIRVRLKQGPPMLFKLLFPSK